MRSIIILWLLWCPFFISANSQDPSYLSKLISEAKAKKLSDSRYWHLLMHYRPRYFGGIKSEVDGKKFFLSPKGKTNADLELAATLNAFFDPASKDASVQHPQCQFRARYLWLKKELSFDSAQLPEHACPAFDEWFKVLNPNSMSLVFASYYLNNPSTMFGHLFLRLNQVGSREDHRLLHYTVNYAAETGNDGGILFAVLGLIGGYPGKYSTLPYYMKVQEYNHKENRDLWEYELRFTSEEVHRMVYHLWELGSTHFNYFFGDENCAYHLVTLLEVGDPNLFIHKKLHFFVTPSDAARIVYEEPGLVTHVNYRPSVLSQFFQKKDSLNSKERKKLRTLITTKNLHTIMADRSINDSKKALILDTANDYAAHRTPGEIETEFQKELLLKQSELPEPDTYVAKPQSTPPSLGQDSIRVGFGGGYASDQKAFQSIRIRGAYHDLLSNEEGYPENASIEILKMNFRLYNEVKSFRVEDLTLIHVLSIFPVDPYLFKLSWNVSFGLESTSVSSRERINNFFVSGGAGLAFKSRLFKKEVYYLFSNVHFQAAPWETLGYRFGPLGRAGVLVDLTKNIKFHVNGQLAYSPWGFNALEKKIQFEQRVSLARNHELRLQASKNEFTQEAFSKCTLLALVFLNVACTNIFYQPSKVVYFSPKLIDGHSIEEVDFKSLDGTPLKAWHFKSSHPKPRGLILQFHGNGENMTSHFRSLAWLTREGYELLTFDYRGYGESQGSPFPKGVAWDAISAIMLAIERAQKKSLPVTLYGQSLGGAIVLGSLKEIEKRKLDAKIQNIVIESSFLSYKRMATEVLSRFWFTWPFQWLGHVLVTDAQSGKRHVKKRAPIPMFIMHGRYDGVVPLRHGEHLYKKAKDPRELWVLDSPAHAHLMSRQSETQSQDRGKLLEFLKGQ